MQLPGTSKYLYGIQETNAPFSVLKKGWYMGYIEVGDNPEPHPGVDYAYLAERGYGTIARIQYRWGEKGTFPKPDKLSAYVERVQSCVRNSRGIHRWQIGNEPNVPQEWNEGWKIQPAYAALCYNQCWSAIHDLTGHEFDEVITPPIGPWNDLVGMGWVDYFRAMLEQCEFVDAIALHAYTHGSEPNLVRSEAMMNSPYEDCHYNFRCYRDFLHAVPPRFSFLSSRIVPVYITETNQYEPWLDEANGWIPAMYREIDDWNQSGEQVIQAALLYRWSDDKWYIKGKGHVVEDLLYAQSLDLTWPSIDPDPPDPCDPCAQLEAIAARLAAVEQEIDQINARLRAAGVILIGKET